MKYFGTSALPHDDNGIVVLGGIDSSDPNVVLPFEIDAATGGLVVKLMGNVTIGSEVEIKNDTGNPVPVLNQSQLVPSIFDDIRITAFNANNDPTTVEYYASAVLVATLTLTYDGSNRLTRVRRT